jgi:Fe-S-cluster containining protein
METSEINHCKRTGQCCKIIPIPISPRQLREDYKKYIKGQDYLHANIEIIYPMLKNRCLGKRVMFKSKQLLYLYGPCKNYEEINGLPTCRIQNNKPWMCSSYPNGGHGTFKGCGFNLALNEPEYGYTVGGLSSNRWIIPLEENEK